MNTASSHPMIQTRNLGMEVDSPEGRLHLLQDIDLSVMPGEAVAVLGISGSGKSTLLGLLAGLDTPTRGQIWLDGTEITALDEDGRAAMRAQLLGFVFQSFQLLPNLTALENTMLPLELAGADAPHERAAELLAVVGLSERARHLPHQLSGGEQQRVAIARAFATRPRLLLADEPTGNLDTRTGAQVIDLLFGLNAEQGTTLLLVTHDAGLAGRCDRALELEAGRLPHPA
ncbi:ABC transporter ATP-binding protein [Thiohalomonas denitrificans]|uniref:ABC transporter ATP-binding protein n=1 Tax=Thiohalomonas denitrificans TaxID=415747 RepID=UPI0026EDB66C|nr:ABC transporter ATP-binding protein [Thiohalomonas denitrificans]